MNIKELKEYAYNEVKYNNVILHKEHLATILYLIEKQDIFQLKQCEMNAFYLLEKNYFFVIVKELENIIKQKSL